MFTEIKEITSTLAELSKGYETLSNRELNKSLDCISRNSNSFHEDILPHKDEGHRRDAEIEKELEKKQSESEELEKNQESSDKLEQVVKNKLDGIKREEQVEEELEKKI